MVHILYHFDFILFIEVKQRLVSFSIKDFKLRFELNGYYKIKQKSTGN